MSTSENQIIVYQPNETIRLETRYAHESLKAYLLKGYAVNVRLAQLEDKMDRHIASHDARR